MGAGFSRNWGGWLANEAFEYLLSREFSPDVRRLLIDNRANGFESALATLQEEARRSNYNRSRLAELEQAVKAMSEHRTTLDPRDGFRDGHINTVLEGASKRALLRTFIIDPLGLDVTNPYYGHPGIPAPTELYDAMVWRGIGACRRGLREILERDGVELAKVMRFFES